LGFSLTSHIQKTPILVRKLKNIVSVSCGNDHALALDTKGKVWAWGYGQQNQLGRRVVELTRVQALVPRKIGIPRKIIRSIHYGSFHSLALKTDRIFYVWGLNSYAHAETTDDGTTVIVPVPTPVKSLQELNIPQLDGGDKHSIALTNAGDGGS
jgi:regulator of chromosome condensation